MEILLFQTKIENSHFQMDYQRHQYLVYPVPVSGHLVVVANLSFLDLLILRRVENVSYLYSMNSKR